jgi:hypothetical protein
VAAAAAAAAAAAVDALNAKQVALDNALAAGPTGLSVLLGTVGVLNLRQKFANPVRLRALASKMPMWTLRHRRGDAAAAASASARPEETAAAAAAATARTEESEVDDAEAKLMELAATDGSWVHILVAADIIMDNE